MKKLIATVLALMMIACAALAEGNWYVDEGQALALRMLQYSPEPRVIERLIESATLLGLDDEAAFHLQRYRVAYPKDHARWQKKNGASGEPLMPGRAPGVVVAPS